MIEVTDSRRSILRFGAIAALFLVLAACGPREPAPTSPYASSSAPLQFTSAIAEFSDLSTLPEDATFIDRRRSEELATQAIALLERRLLPTGGVGVLRIEILEASVIEREREVQGGFRGFFTREAKGEIDTNLRVRVAVIDERGLEADFAEAHVQRIRPILEGTGAIGEEADAQNAINGLLGQLDMTIDKAVRENLQRYLINS